MSTASKHDHQFSTLIKSLRTFQNWNFDSAVRFDAFKTAAGLVAPWVKWNPWSEWTARRKCERRIVAATGCATASKTFTFGLWGYLFWLANPDATSVVLTSTTSKMVRKRIWPVIQDIHARNPFRTGNMVDSKTTLQNTRGDDKNGIFCIAIRDGPLERALGNIKGVHNQHMFVMIDEATDTPEAIFEAINNLQKGCDDFNLGVLGNATSKLDPHGRVCAPKDGWPSIGIDDDEWEIAGVSKWGIEDGICLHYDGEKSPNVLADEDKWPFIFTRKDLKRANSFPDARETISYWKETRGFWAPEGICRTVFSEALIQKYDGRGKHIFRSSKTKIASCDFAFGGDRCVYQSGDLGDLDDGRSAIQLDAPVTIPLLATSPEPVHYQIARWIIRRNSELKVAPKSFGGDATGEGAGVMAIISQEWGSQIHWVEFGGSPSDIPASSEDQRPSNEVYDRKVTELWYSCREWLAAGQIKGFGNEAIIQFCSREYSIAKRKIILDKKDDCRKKIGRSPDEADAVVILVEVAKRLGARAANRFVQDRGKEQRENLRKYSQVYEHVDYASEAA